MKIFPAIDLYGGKAVRLLRGDYAQMTVYSDDPVSVALEFARQGAEAIHLVDLEGARDGGTPNLHTVCEIKEKSGLFCEVGGGVRSFGTVQKYISAGLDRVILGTAAVNDSDLVARAAGEYGSAIAVGADVKDGFVAVKGWTELSGYTVDDFFAKMSGLGVRVIICTDVSKDGAMRGTNRELYARLTAKFGVDVVASGGVSSIEDVVALKETGVYGAIIGKAYYVGAVDLARAIEVAK